MAVGRGDEDIMSGCPVIMCIRDEGTPTMPVSGDKVRVVIITSMDVGDNQNKSEQTNQKHKEIVLLVLIPKAK